MATREETRIEYINVAIDRYAKELAEGDIKPDYSVNGQSFQWVEYREFLSKEIERLTALIDTVSEDGGIVVEETQTTN